MNYRLATILAREAVSTDFTKVIDLNLADPVSQFHITYESTGVGSAEADAHAARCVTKIELVDGSDVLFSLSGQECQAVDFYHRKIEPANMSVYLGGMNAEMVFNVNFGRYLWDPLFSFDPRKFTNPQLKITIDRNAGGVVSVAGFLTVLAHIFDGKELTPEGLLMHKEITNYSMGSAAHEYIDLPTDFPYRKLLVAAQSHGIGLEYMINTMKLSEDNDRKIPFDLTMINYLRAVVGLQPPYRERLLVDGGTSGFAFYCTPCYWPRVAISHWEASVTAKHASIDGGDGGRGHYYLEGPGGNYDIAVEGWCPHGAVEIPFGLQDDPADWYDVTKLGSLRLDILSVSGRGASDTVQIYLQQLRKY